MENKGFAKKGPMVAIVTGGSMGIGESTIRLLVEKGHRVIIGDIADEEGIALMEELNQESKVVHFVHADMTKAADIENLFKSAIDEFGVVDWLVNNAGIVVAKSTTELTEEDWDYVLNLNLKGAWMCSKIAIPLMKDRVGAAIVNVASNAGIVGFPNLAAYCASKGGLIQFTKACALDCASLGIRVNAVAPGHTRTSMGMGFINDQPDPEKFEIEHVNEKHPLGRMAEPDEVASAIYFLLNNSSSYITGSVLSVDGGYVAA
jgi:NAD(P)-dependent dehydrogenase (short-subunit alcohol dehydrogenase family)